MERPAGLPRTRERHFHLAEVDLGKRGQTDAGSTEKGCDLKGHSSENGKGNKQAEMSANENPAGRNRLSGGGAIKAATG
jgi:hypothetical protein